MQLLHYAVHWQVLKGSVDRLCTIIEKELSFLYGTILGMLGEAVKNPEMAQRYVNTHTHECKNIFFSKIP